MMIRRSSQQHVVSFGNCPAGESQRGFCLGRAKQAYDVLRSVARSLKALTLSNLTVLLIGIFVGRIGR